jgi:large subunit ribosomal protein L17
MSRNNSLHTKRKLLSYFYDDKAVQKLLEDLGPRYKERPGGYMRITKIGLRQGDGARVVQLEFV